MENRDFERNDFLICFKDSKSMKNLLDEIEKNYAKNIKEMDYKKGNFNEMVFNLFLIKQKKINN